MQWPDLSADSVVDEFFVVRILGRVEITPVILSRLLDSRDSPGCRAREVVVATNASDSHLVRFRQKENRHWGGERRGSEVWHPSLKCLDEIIVMWFSVIEATH